MRKDPVPNLSSLWPTVLPKMVKSNLKVLSRFYVFGLFDLQNDQIQISPDPPTVIWGCPIFKFWRLFCQGSPYASTFFKKIYFQIFLRFWSPLSWIFHIFPDFPSFCIHIHAAVLRTESVLVFQVTAESRIPAFAARRGRCTSLRCTRTPVSHPFLKTEHFESLNKILTCA